MTGPGSGPGFTPSAQPLTPSGHQVIIPCGGSMQIHDRHLVRRCLTGDRQAFDTLYDRHAARVFHLLRRLTGDEAEAEDWTQETLLAASRSLQSWRREGDFGTWLSGMV